MLSNEEINNTIPIRQEDWSDKDMCFWMGRFVEREIMKRNESVIRAITDISNMCIGEIAMGYSLDPQMIGELIYEATGMTNPQLNDYIKALNC